MRQIVGNALALVLIGSSFALADPWKDESGKGRGGWKHEGETPNWAPGKGYWDGHFKHGRGETPDWGRGRGYWDGHFKNRDRDWERGYWDDRRFGYDHYGYGGHGYGWRGNPYGYDYRWAPPPRYGTGYRGYGPQYSPHW